MSKKLEKRGFVTIATGKDEYFELAKNLLLSYKYHTQNPLPFAIICDKENEITALFDKVLILDNPTYTWNDKLSMYKFDIFEETIFIDADCLVFGDINGVFELFKDATRISCFGNVYNRESDEAWFKCSEVGKYGEKPEYTINTNTGIVYIKNEGDEFLKEFYNLAQSVYKDFYNLKFSLFKVPADEPISSLALCNVGCKPISPQRNTYILTLPISNVKKIDILNGKLIGTQGANLTNTTNTSWKILHYEHSRTKGSWYLDEVKILNELVKGDMKAAKRLRRKVNFKRKKYNFIVWFNKTFRKK